MPVNKKHDEFYTLDMTTGWEVPAGYPAGIQQKIISGGLDEENRRGTRTRLLEREHTAAAPRGRVRLDEEVIGLGLLATLSDRLDDGHLQVLVCRFVDDMTQDEIATHLGVSRKTVGKRLDRIRDAVIALRSEEAS